MPQHLARIREAMRHPRGRDLPVNIRLTRKFLQLLPILMLKKPLTDES